jgi:tRNA pseudouridine55 synthase
MKEVSELLLIDKPIGITSMDVIRRLRRILGIRKIGHAGTLDPLATGLMLVGVGKGTKTLTTLIKLDKEYLAEVRLGECRTTGDLEGMIMEEKVVTDELSVLRDKIANRLQSLIGTQELPVSAYSAIKVDGVPMYKRARNAEKKGEVVTDVPLREMKVYEAELKNLSVGDGRAVATIRFTVGSGTYIRSLAEALGASLGYPATLQALRRTQVGEYSLDDAQSLESIAEYYST